jgi:quercetin dioxygenase-like cupin family protein
VAEAGDVIDNPVTGETITFLQTARDTRGERLQFELLARPGGAPVAAHRHPRQTERFEVLEGTLWIRVEGQERSLSQGEEITVPVGAPHFWKNPTDAPLRVRIEFMPALRWEELFETMFALARDGKTDRQGRTNPLQAAVIFNEFHEEAAPVTLVDRGLFATFPLLARVGRALGYRPTYRRTEPGVASTRR